MRVTKLRSVTNEPHIIAAANRKRRRPPDYDGPVYLYRVLFEIKAPNVREGDKRIETLLAELVTGADIEASDLWVRSATLVGGND